MEKDNIFNVNDSVFAKELKEATVLYQKKQDVNTIEALEYYYQLNNTDYEDCSKLALDKCIQQRIDFSSTSTTTHHIFNNFISIKCPECSMPMDYSHSKYECGFCKIVISLDLNAIHFNFFQPYWDRIETSKPYINSDNSIEIQIKGFRNNSSKGELLAKVIKKNNHGSEIQVKVAYEWILQNKLIKQTLENIIEKIDLIDSSDINNAK